MTTKDDLSWADAYPGVYPFLGEIFCLTFVKEVDATEALRRMGGYPDTIDTRTLTEIGDLHNFDDGFPDMASAVALGDWTVLFEPSGFTGSGLITALSLGTEAVSVLRHDYASPRFGYAVDGELITEFDPTFPTNRHGADPDRLLPQMLDVGFTVTEDEEGEFDDDMFDDDTARSLRLTERLTGALPTFEVLTGPLTSAQFEKWFSQARKPPAGRPHHTGPVNAVDEVRRLTALHSLTDTPGLEDALAATKPVQVTSDSPLGQHVRGWLAEAQRASWSLNGHARGRMTDTQRRRAHDLGWLAAALGAALQADPEPGNRPISS
nr:DUF6461 domain-containing protein [Kibdelosporangium sp. MJ126-NF4]CEL16500.1 hypothetical protein [Kibdelosporangium sp. MJ126-NF4]CTQ90452.1 hypothetical protein [Kibdelosporangium sp. MJ126-NF4]